MTEDTFLVRLILTNNAAAASKLNSERVHLGEKPDRVTILKTAETIKTDFVTGIEFLMGLDFLQIGEHLFYLFKLSCFCVTVSRPQNPAATVGSVDTAGYRDHFTDVDLPCREYVSGVPDSVSFGSREANLSNFYLLSDCFGLFVGGSPLD